MDYAKPASEEAIKQTVEALKQNNFLPLVLESKAEALTKIKELIPSGASVMNGASRSLEEIGYIDYLKGGQHGWNNLHEKILNETNPLQKAALRKASVVSDFYLGSVHALTETGEMLIASNTGSQLPHLAFTSQNLILVVGSQKIVSDLKEAFQRLNARVIPLEDERMKAAYGYGTMHNKTLLLHQENPSLGRRVHVLIVKEAVGF